GGRGVGGSGRGGLGWSVGGTATSWTPKSWMSGLRAATRRCVHRQQAPPGGRRPLDWSRCSAVPASKAAQVAALLNRPGVTDEERRSLARVQLRHRANWAGYWAMPEQLEPDGDLSTIW